MKLTPRILVLVLAVAGCLGIAYLGYWSWHKQKMVSNAVNQVVVQSNEQVNVNASSPTCSKILDEQTCTARLDCFGMYGPSKCENGSCTSDRVFKTCRDNYVYSNCLYSGGTWDSSKKMAREQCTCPEGKTLTLSGYTCEETKTEKKYDYIASNPGILEQICPKEILAERNNIYDPYANWVVNDGCAYDYKSKKLDEQYTRPKNCALTLEEEISKEDYTIVNSCLYRKKVRVFDKTIHSQITSGEFGKTNPGAKFNDSIRSIGEAADEWFRYDKNNEITFFFRGGAGCGGCIFNGPYLTLKTDSGKVVKKGVDWTIPYLPNLVLSPDHTKAIEFTTSEAELDKETPISGDEPKALFYVYDFITLKRQELVFEYAEADGVLSCGHGCYLADGVVTWLDNDTVSFQIFKIDRNDPGQLLRNDDGFYIQDGSPKVVALSKM